MSTVRLPKFRNFLLKTVPRPHVLCPLQFGVLVLHLLLNLVSSRGISGAEDEIKDLRDYSAALRTHSTIKTGQCLIFYLFIFICVGFPTDKRKSLKI